MATWWQHENAFLLALFRLGDGVLKLSFPPSGTEAIRWSREERRGSISSSLRRKPMSPLSFVFDGLPPIAQAI